MKYLQNILKLLAVVIPAAIAMSSCSHTKSYAELLNDETKYINAYLADQRVIGSVPADSVFIQEKMHHTTEWTRTARYTCA